MRNRLSVFLICMVFLAGCVTEQKDSNADKEFLKQSADPVSGIIATKITVHCQVRNEKTKRSVPCAMIKVKSINQVTKATNTESFKGGSALANVGRDVYALEVSTSSCPAVRTFAGLMAGTVIDAYFDPPCGLK